MSSKKENPLYVNIDERYYHMQLLFPVKGQHDPDADEFDEEGCCGDFLAKHGMYAMSPLEEKTGECEVPQFDAFVHNDCAWAEPEEGDDSMDPLARMIALEEASDELQYPDYDPYADLSAEDEAMMVSQCSCVRLSMFDHSLRDCEIRKHQRRNAHGSWKSHLPKYGKHGHDTIRGARIEVEYFYPFDFMRFPEIIAIPRVQR